MYNDCCNGLYMKRFDPGKPRNEQIANCKVKVAANYHGVNCSAHMIYEYGLRKQGWFYWVANVLWFTASAVLR